MGQMLGAGVKTLLRMMPASYLEVPGLESGSSLHSSFLVMHTLRSST